MSNFLAHLVVDIWERLGAALGCRRHGDWFELWVMRVKGERERGSVLALMAGGSLYTRRGRLMAWRTPFELAVSRRKLDTTMPFDIMKFYIHLIQIF